MELGEGGGAVIDDGDEDKKDEKKECEDVFHPRPEINEIHISITPPLHH